MKRGIRNLLSLVFLVSTAFAQTQSPSHAAQVSDPSDPGAYGYLYRAALACGAGASESTAAVKPTVQCGGSFTFLPFVDVEVGAMEPQSNRSPVSGYLSTNLSVPLAHPHKRVFPVLVGGYTRMFETGNALDYGFAIARTIDSTHSIQFEVRHYWANANPSQHNVVFRVAWLVCLPDRHANSIDFRNA